MCYQFRCKEPRVISVPMNDRGRIDYDHGKPEEIDKFAIGALAGIVMALDDFKTENRWFGDFKLHDVATFECTGIQEANEQGQSDMPEFQLTIERD